MFCGKSLKWSFSPARYATRQVAFRAEGPDGLKSPSAYMAGALGGKYSNREGAYILSLAKARILRSALEKGWAVGSNLGGEVADFKFYPPGEDPGLGKSVSYKEMKRLLGL